MLSNPFHVDIMFFQGVFGKKNPDNGIYGGMPLQILQTLWVILLVYHLDIYYILSQFRGMAEGWWVNPTFC